MTEDAARALGRDLLGIHQEAYGAAAEDARVHMLGDDIVVFLDALELQRNEEFLITKGREDLVLDTRTGFQQSMQPVFAAAVERATGRRVVAFLSSTNLDPPFAVEIFRLAPAGSSDGGS